MKYRSRLARHQVRQSRRQTWLYLLLSVLLVVGILKVGVPGFIQLVSWWTGKDAPQEAVDLDIPPQAPVLGEIPEATFSSQISVYGLAQMGTKIKLSVNDEAVDETNVGEDGSFIFNKVSLADGENRLSLISLNEKNKESQPTVALVIVDKTAPELEITEPQTEVQVVGAQAQNLMIKGKTDESETEIRVNDHYVMLATDDTFEYRTRLNEGLNEFVITAVDLAGNKTEKLLRVNFSL